MSCSANDAHGWHLAFHEISIAICGTSAFLLMGLSASTRSFVSFFFNEHQAFDLRGFEAHGHRLTDAR